ncbi:MAG: Txe/YoeB family addiction module toxin [Anaerococcus obesiensis]|uniref:Txe/YoeB family addiction module toxin n=1 Tax=Anaerococcus TaxID=165779 RepID=UPI0002F8B701|nr:MULTISPECIES: Txe/YoeB family addiction module toxin [Anaerococcus]MDU1030271.1 Txe/YoeB family addiction module toxin [Anaerococcus vaginalis]
MKIKSLKWDFDAWNDYLYWQKADKNNFKRINQLIKDIKRNPFEGIGKPEPLKENLKGLWSRRIDKEHRLVYFIDDDSLVIFQCKCHYK